MPGRRPGWRISSFAVSSLFISSLPPIEPILIPPVSSEIALLGIASIQGAKGTSIWLILIFPVLFTAGMCLLDTIDGALMMTLYTSTALAKDRVAILYYSIVLTTITIIVAVVIGFIQLLSLIQNVAEPSGKFWDGVAVAGDHYDVIGTGILTL